MSDIALKQDDSGAFDISLDRGDLTTHSGLENAVILSLFTDLRVDDDELLDGDDKRGWWSRIFGSRLWLLERATTTKETLDRAEYYSTEALQWLIDDGVASAVAAHAEWSRDGVMLLVIEIVKPNGTATFKFEDIWSAQLNGVY